MDINPQGLIRKIKELLGWN